MVPGVSVIVYAFDRHFLVVTTSLVLLTYRFVNNCLYMII